VPKPPVPVVVIDAGPPPAPVVLVAAEPDAGLEEEVDAGSAVVDVTPKNVPARNGRLELRIRPYATVWLDDRKLGDTPLPAVSVPLGKHKLRLVNTTLGKDVELTVTIKPGDNVVKHNLKE
jgi:serine/threonine-protein kinase